MTASRPGNPPTRGRLIRSFGFASRGLVFLVRQQANARIHAAITIAVFTGAFLLPLQRWEWCALLGVAGLVWTAEALNTAVEVLTDLVSPNEHPLAGQAKDLAAGGVLVAAMIAGIVGAIVFLPHLLR